MFCVQHILEFLAIYFRLYNHEESTIITASSASNATVFFSKSGSTSGTSTKSTNGKQSNRRGEEEWKEVVRK